LKKASCPEQEGAREKQERKYLWRKYPLATKKFQSGKLNSTHNSAIQYNKLFISNNHYGNRPITVHVVTFYPVVSVWQMLPIGSITRMDGTDHIG
jgi:hypothetical protein